MTAPTPREEIAALLDRERRRKNLSIRAVARLVDLPPATVQGWLSGKHSPTPALRPQFERLVQALGLEGRVHPEWLDVDRTLGTLRDVSTPYVGLRPYAITEEPLFFGRDAEATRIATAIARHAPQAGLVALVGPSGSGKSSLLAAGLIGRHCAPDGLLTPRRGTVLAVRDLLRTPDPDANLVVLDQFEEVLTLGDDRDATLARVLALAERATVVLALRSDSYGALAELPQLHDALERPLLIQPMTPEEVRLAITGPARLRGVEVDPALVEVILTDVGSERDAPATLTLLPLVSHALLLTWGAGSGQRMTIDDYLAAGGLSSAVETLADGIVAALGPDERRTARQLFMRLVGLSDDRPIRRPVALATLTPAELAVARPFVDARVLTTTETDLMVSHDSVLVHWPRLADWIEEGREQLRVRDHLGRAARLWVASDRAPASLIPVDRLPLFAGLGAEDGDSLLSPVEREFLAESREHFTSQLQQERRTSARLRRRGHLAFVLTAATLVLALLTGSALLETRRVQLAAQSRQVANQASTVRDSDTNLHAQLSLVGASIASTRESISALLSSTALDVPARWTSPGSAFVTTGPGASVARADGAGRIALWRSGTLHGPPDVVFQANPAGEQLFAVALGLVDDRLLLVTGGAGGYRALWDVTGEPTLVGPLGDGGTLFAAAFEPVRRGLVLAHSDGVTSTLERWSIDRLTTPDRVASVEFPEQVSALAITPDGTRVYTAGTRDHVGAWLLSDGGLTPGDTVPLGADPGIRALSLSVSPDGQHLAAGLSSGQVARWSLDADTPAPLGLTAVSTFWVNGVAWSGDGSRLLTGDSEQRLHVWATDSMALLRSERLPALVQSVGWVGPEPIATAVDGTLMRWPATSPTLRQGGGRLYYLAADAAGSRLAATDQLARHVELWGLQARADGPELLVFPEGLDVAVSTAMSPAGDRVVGSTRDGQVVVWDIADARRGIPRVSRIAPEGNLVSIAISPDGSLLAAGLYGGRGTVLARIQPDSSVVPLATLPTPVPQLVSFSPDGRFLQVGIASGSVDLWEVTDPSHPRQAGSVPTATNPGASTFAPAGARLALGTDAGEVALSDWSDPDHPALVRRLLGPRAGINAVAFSPDGSVVVAGGAGGTLWGWDLTTDDHDPEFALPADMGAIHDVEFVDGTTVALTGATGDVRLWGIDATRARTALCAARGEPLTADEWDRHLPGIEPRDPCRTR